MILFRESEEIGKGGMSTTIMLVQQTLLGINGKR